MSAYSTVRKLRDAAVTGAVNLSAKIAAGLICPECHNDLDEGGECDRCAAEFDYDAPPSA